MIERVVENVHTMGAHVGAHGGVPSGKVLESLPFGVNTGVGLDGERFLGTSPQVATRGFRGTGTTTVSTRKARERAMGEGGPRIREMSTPRRH